MAFIGCRCLVEVVDECNVCPVTERTGIAIGLGEQRQAQSWAVAYVRHKGIFGKLAGVALSGDLGNPMDVVGEPATAALVTVSIPLLIQLARRALKAAEREGAPADPQATSNTATTEPGTASDQNPEAAPADED
jgi:hypothetical protein